MFDFFGRGKGDKKKEEGSAEAKPNPVLDEYKRKHGAEPVAPAQARQAPSAGDIGASSIFEDERRVQLQQDREAAADDGDGEAKMGGKKRDPANIERIVEPNPRARERWERKKVIQMMRKSGRLNKAQYLKRTEREHVARSHNMKTSVKKLGMLARQIAGKPIDDAITQMRFSKKKVAQDVLKQLEMVRDEAVVMRGMGLGKATATETASNLNDTSPLMVGDPSPSSSPQHNINSGPVEIQLKDGKRHKVLDRSQIYIQQAWVGRGPFGKLPDYRARGQVNIMRTPWTSLSVVLKEETTRVREWQEREEKRRKDRLGKVWTHLPDRPVQWQRQWYAF